MLISFFIIYFKLLSFSLFSFYTICHKDLDSGHWRFAGAFAVVKRQSECGSKTAGMHVSQPMNIMCVMG